MDLHLAHQGDHQQTFRLTRKSAAALVSCTTQWRDKGGQKTA